MAYRKKFRIRGLRQGESFSDTARPVLVHYLKRVIRRGRTYQEQAGIENLHDLRIALRRFRYVLELYSSTIKPRRFEHVYDLAVTLQNLLGERRDLDVMLAKLSGVFSLPGSQIPEGLRSGLEREMTRLDVQIRENLVSFLSDKQVLKIAHD